MKSLSFFAICSDDITHNTLRTCFSTPILFSTVSTWHLTFTKVGTRSEYISAVLSHIFYIRRRNLIGYWYLLRLLFSHGGTWFSHALRLSALSCYAISKKMTPKNQTSFIRFKSTLSPSLHLEKVCALSLSFSPEQLALCNLLQLTLLSKNPLQSFVLICHDCQLQM